VMKENSFITLTPVFCSLAGIFIMVAVKNCFDIVDTLFQVLVF